MKIIDDTLDISVVQENVVNISNLNTSRSVPNITAASAINK